MAKKDINFIKHIKKDVKHQEVRDKGYSIAARNTEITLQQLHLADSIYESALESSRKETCRLAAKMSPSERLMNYIATRDGTYLGTGCHWDMLTQMGLNRRGGLF